LSRTDLVWRDGWKEWCQAGSLPEVFAAPPPRPPKLAATSGGAESKISRRVVTIFQVDRKIGTFNLNGAMPIVNSVLKGSHCEGA
jgi:hypothetical protein